MTRHVGLLASYGAAFSAYSSAYECLSSVMMMVIRPLRPDPEVEAHVEALEDELTRLRGQLGETSERLDFAERLLTRGGEGRREP